MRSTLLLGTSLVTTCAFSLITLVSFPALAQKSDPKKTDKTDSSSSPSVWSETEKKSGDGKSDDSKKLEGDMKKEGSTSAASSVEPPAEKWDISDVDEIPGKSYFFIGLRYRGNLIPRFMVNLFVDEGATVYTNMVGAEFDLRKDGFSLIPALSYHEVGTEDILFKQKNTKDIAGNYSVVNSSLKIMYASVDLLWSTKISKNVEFEYGAGFGLGVVFGDLSNNWVQEDASGPLQADGNGKRYKRCPTEQFPSNGNGCAKADHQNSEVAKVGDYTEPSWANGGSKPNLFPWIAVPQLGLRFKPVKVMTARLGIGFALTGFWFGLSADYGLEKKPTQ